MSVGAHLANRAPNDKKYLDRAQREWEWFRDSNMFNEKGTINDGLTEDCKNNGQTEYAPPGPLFLPRVLWYSTSNKSIDGPTTKA